MRYAAEAGGGEENSRRKAIGVGISAPGPVDYKEGVILTPPNFEMFHHIPVAEYMVKKLRLPVMVDNNAVLFAMQEYILMTKQSLNAIVIIVSDGIGSAIITQGKVYRGHSAKCLSAAIFLIAMSFCCRKKVSGSAACRLSGGCMR